MNAAAGPLNLITDVPGLSVGQSEETAVRSGVTVILPDERVVCAVDARGGAPGTRETDAVAPDTLVEAVDAVVLAGGSVFGLAAADGVAAWLAARGRGYRIAGAGGLPPSPIVPAAILYDLANGGDKNWGLDPPYRRLGLDAAAAAGRVFALGAAGAGTGAMAGALKGGIGSSSAITADGFTVGALAAVNSFGSVLVPGSHAFWAAPFEIGAEYGGVAMGEARAAPDDWGDAKINPARGANTTLGCVATDARLTPTQARRLAIMAQDGIARAIRPAHAPFDGDIVFALATARRPLPSEREDFTLARLGALAADCLARAIARGVYEAKPWPGSGIRAWRDIDR